MYRLSLLAVILLSACILDPCDSPLWEASRDGVRTWAAGPDTLKVEIDKGCTAYPCTIVGAASTSDAIRLCAAAHGLATAH